MPVLISQSTKTGTSLAIPAISGSIASMRGASIGQVYITEAYNAFTDVTFDGEGHMTSWSWNAGNLDAATLTLSSGYDWYQMTGENLERAKEDFGEFEFSVNGNTATSSMVGIENITFNKVN